ncbi:ceramidase domain-containing protein [Celeribacter arenosi]|uniref:Ceramidase domain-containing protein n=1 Tax=Celeribacter arenosi TaxID=792649 RepID=A0ABP7JSB8_9RHOB
MDWTAQIDSYCERVDFTFWSEPANAVTNAAFLIAALFVWPMAKLLPGARALAIILFLIGLGSFAFHTTATRWGAMADSLPILAFILTYIFLASRDFFGLAGWRPYVLTLGFIPFAAVFTPIFAWVGMGSSAAYAPVPLLIFIYAFLLRHSAPQTARGLAIGAATLCVSIGFRMLDAPICGVFPLGTHFLWHLLNAVMLAHMIRVYGAHMLEGRATLG